MVRADRRPGASRGVRGRPGASGTQASACARRGRLRFRPAAGRGCSRPRDLL